MFLPRDIGSRLARVGAFFAPLLFISAVAKADPVSAGNYIRNQSSRQAGAKLNITSGTIQNFNTDTIKFGNGSTMTTAPAGAGGAAVVSSITVADLSAFPQKVILSSTSGHLITDVNIGANTSIGGTGFVTGIAKIYAFSTGIDDYGMVGVVSKTGASGIVGIANGSGVNRGGLFSAVGGTTNIGIEVSSGSAIFRDSVTVTGLTAGQCVQAGTGGLLTVSGSACGSGAGSGSSIYPSTGVPTFPYSVITASITPVSGAFAIGGAYGSGLSEATLTVSSITVGYINMIGAGGGSWSLVEGAAQSGLAGSDVIYGNSTTHWLTMNNNNGLPYSIPGSSTTNTVGHSAVWTSAYTIGDGGVAGGGSGTPGIPVNSVQYNAASAFAGNSNFNFSGSSLTILTPVVTSSFSVVVGTESTGNQNRGALDVYVHNTPADGTAVLLSLGSKQQTNQFVVTDLQPVNMIRYGADIGNLLMGLAASPYKIYTNQSVQNYLDLWNSGAVELKSATSANGGKQIIFYPRQVEALRLTETGSVFSSSITVTVGVPFKWNYRAAVCQDGSASLGFSTYTSSGPTATCSSGGQQTFGEAYFVDTATNTVQDHLSLPADWVGTIDVGIVWRSTVTANDVVWKIRTACVADAEVPGDTAWNFYNSVTDTAKGTTLQLNTATISAITTTGCAAGEEMYFEFIRDPANASDTLIGTARLVGITFTVKRTL